MWSTICRTVRKTVSHATQRTELSPSDSTTNRVPVRLPAAFFHLLTPTVPQVSCGVPADDLNPLRLDAERTPRFTSSPPTPARMLDLVRYRAGTDLGRLRRLDAGTRCRASSNVCRPPASSDEEDSGSETVSSLPETGAGGTERCFLSGQPALLVFRDTDPSTTTQVLIS